MPLSEKRKQAVKYEVIEGYVWCDRNGEVHEDSLDPYEYAEELCEPQDHSPIYRAAEGKVE
jgi:hypothetical protein